ncbi:MAG: M48 metallopeptidase family protein [Candidatus Heimdallarchaeaceae archaeon]
MRNQKTLWASCSSNGNLSFNLRCGILPENLLMYLIVHELLHRKIPNHGKKFKEEISALYPNYKDKEDLLKAYWFLSHSIKVFN